MHWSADAVWWHVYPLGFTGAERDALPARTAAVPRIRQLSEWLDYLVELGCNGLALGPVFESETHGYDTVDYFRVDRRLGTEKDFVELVERAAGKGVRVLLDGVFNHVGRGFAPFADVLERGAESPYAGWFHAEPDGSYATFEGHEHLVALNHDEPAVADHVVEVMTYWLDRGIAGWRLDAAYAVPRPFWRVVGDRVRARHPEVWLCGEVIHGDYGAFRAEGGLDAVTQYELWKAIWSSLNDRNLHELAWALTRHNGFLEAITPQIFVGNHDVTRIASRIDDIRLLEHALVILLTVGGVPSVYYGDEQAFRGIKEERVGGDDEIRPAFPERPDQLASYGWPTYRLHQELIGLRRRNPWLVDARTSTHHLTNTALVYTVAAGEERLAVALNLADEPARLPLPDGSWTPIAGRDDPGRAGEVGEDMQLPPTGWMIVGTA